MANRTGSNPAYLDDFGQDNTVTTGSVRVSLITVTENGGTARKVTFIDNEGNTVLVIQVGASSTINWAPAHPIEFANGLIFDESASTVVDNDQIFIYKV